MFSNRMNFEIDYEVVNRTFYCIQITATRVEEGQYALPFDLIQKIGDYCQPVSVMHQFRESMYIIFDKKQEKHASIIKKFQESTEYRDLGLTFSPIVFTAEKGENIKTHLTGYWVLQILINSLAHNNLKSLNPEYQNLYGRLFIPVSVAKNSKRYRDVFEIKFEKPNFLTIHVSRFARFETKEDLAKWIKFNKKSGNVFFIYNKTSNAFTRSQDCFADLKKHGQVFVNRTNYNKSHPSVPFIDTSSPDKLHHSRVGMYIRILTDIKVFLGDYIKVLEQEPIPEREYEHIQKPSFSIDQRVSDYYKYQNIHSIQLVDLCKDHEAAEITKVLVQHAQKRGIVLESTNFPLTMIDTRVPVIAIVHNKNYYEEREIHDPYIKDENLIIQHATIEDYLLEDEDVESAVSCVKFLVLLRDLAIKYDLQKGRANFLSLTQEGVHHQYSYHTVKGLIKNKNKPITIYSVNIQDDFSIKTAEYTEEMEGFEVGPIKREIDDICFSAQKKLNQYLQLEGWVENFAGERNYIFVTSEIVMPDLNILKDQMQKVSQELPKELQSPKVIANVIKNILSESEAKADPEKITELANLIHSELLNLSKIRFRSILKSVFPYQSTAYRHLTKRFHEEYGISFGISRGKAAKGLHEYRAGLRYWEEDGIGHYFCGEWELSGIKAVKARADHIRLVIPNTTSRLFFKELLPGMNEEIVHMAERSVLPAGFKYVREYKAMAQSLQTPED